MNTKILGALFGMYVYETDVLNGISPLDLGFEAAAHGRPFSRRGKGGFRRPPKDDSTLI